MMGAKIYLVDVDEMSGQMTVENVLKCIKNNIKKIKAIITMYLGGYVENNIDFYYLKKRLGCFLIEDACHAIGSKYKLKTIIFMLVLANIQIYVFFPSIPSKRLLPERVV